MRTNDQGGECFAWGYALGGRHTFVSDGTNNVSQQGNIILGLESIITVIIALVGSAGFWSFVSMREKTKREAATEYQNTLKDQVDRLASKLDTYTKDKEELLRERM